MAAIIITKSIIIKAGACEQQRKLFSKTFPDGCTITRKNIIKAFAVGLEVEWIANKFYSDQALAEYEKVRDPAWAELQKVRDPALAEYEKVRANKLYDIYIKYHLCKEAIKWVDQLS